MFVPPMLLHQIHQPLEDDLSYITELKLDGVRIILSTFNNKTSLYTIENQDVSHLFPEIHSLPLPNDTILDGELVAIDESGRPDFELLMKRFNTKNEIRIQLVVFDILYYRGENITNLKLLNRKKVLEQLQYNDCLVPVQFTEGNSELFFNVVKKENLEGIVLKDKYSYYYPNHRSKDWLQLVNEPSDCFYLTAIRKKEFGLVVSNERVSGLLKSMPTQALKLLYKSYSNYITHEDEQYIYVEPYLRCMVQYRSITSRHQLSKPTFINWIQD
ncbi:RNA ligase family protein [Alkalihalobacillus trypoxylicola]|uniref:ATP-dependent DNA ligase family profile domain-containing protein n=1 Tax=Alkalihalobacillus trypoxylicola TaxID=519424 RepID=A0A161QNJ4_9BACI|nr:RNA ligase family protein [Alkalihalobacillus trypoxylicola]KYG31943.1 hypothetical protein AZF04_03980 [Alkalihalobacillus trypoxylicola]